MILIDAHPLNEWLLGAVNKRLRQELAKLSVEINEEKSRVVDLRKDESFAFLGFEYRYLPGRGGGKLRLQVTPRQKKRVALFAKLKRGLPAECKSAGRGRDRRDQSYPSRLGELLAI